MEDIMVGNKYRFRFITRKFFESNLQWFEWINTRWTFFDRHANSRKRNSTELSTDADKVRLLCGYFLISSFLVSLFFPGLRGEYFSV